MFIPTKPQAGYEPAPTDAKEFNNLLALAKETAESDVMAGVRMILHWKPRATTDYLAGRLGLTTGEVEANLGQMKLEGQVLDEDTWKPIP